MNCKNCGETYNARSIRHKYCSSECQYLGRAVPGCTCKRCGKAYTAKDNTRLTYCSRECCFRAWRLQTAIRAAQRKFRNRIANLSKKQKPPPKTETQVRRETPCECGNPKAVVNKYTSRHCEECRRKRYVTTRRSRRKKIYDWCYETTIEAIFMRDNGRCYYCGCQTKRMGTYVDGMDVSVMATRDHVIPITKGGTHEPENMVLACQACNTKKSNKRIALF